MNSASEAKVAACDTPLPDRLPLGQVQALLRVTNPYCSAQERDLVIASTHRATDGSEAGLAALTQWYQKRRDYPGPDATAVTWRGITGPADTGIGAAWLCQFVADHGIDWQEVIAQTEPDFEPIDTATPGDPYTVPKTNASSSVLKRYSLKQMRAKLEDIASNQIPLVEGLVLSGQMTVIYGPPSAAKSALMNELGRRDVRSGLLPADKFVYMDNDNNASGLLERLNTLDAEGCHVLAEGYCGFSASKVLSTLEELVAEGSAKGVVVVVDTAKKSVDLMDKSATTAFVKRARTFTNAGGTLICLAHVNKSLGPDGKPIHAGTSDLEDDCDCSYLLYEIERDDDKSTRTVLFENRKRRGPVPTRKAFRYSTADNQTYEELLHSITPVDLQELSTLERSRQESGDRPLIEAIAGAIRAGTVLKMQITANVCQQTRASRQAVLDVLDKYCGVDPKRHRWDFKVGERGGKSYCLLEDTADPDDDLY